MIRTILAIAALLATAQAAPAAYCAMYFNGSRACGIPSLEMCWQSVTGVGGTCEQDFTDRIPPNFVQRLRSDSVSMQRSRVAGRAGAGGALEARHDVAVHVAVGRHLFAELSPLKLQRARNRSNAGPVPRPAARARADRTAVCRAASARPARP